VRESAGECIKRKRERENRNPVGKIFREKKHSAFPKCFAKNELHFAFFYRVAKTQRMP